MVGFDNGATQERVLDGVPTIIINADLTGKEDFSSAQRLAENAKLSFQGTSQVGPFEIGEKLAKAMLDSSFNPNGRSNSDVIKRSINGIDITRRPRNAWTIDFGTERPLDEAELYEEPFEHVREHVKPHRDNLRRKAYRDRWWLYAEARPGMRNVLAPLSRYIVTPWVSKHRVFVWMPADVIPSLVVVFGREDDYFFGVLHSRAHELWARRLGTYMGAGNDLRYTPTNCFEKFPLPWPPGEEPEDEVWIEEIAKAAQRLDELRRNWLNPKGASEAELKKQTLTNLYNARPTWLKNAHAQLDRAVYAAYGWPSDLTDEEVLKNLLALNLERSAGADGS